MELADLGLRLGLGHNGACRSRPPSWRGFVNWSVGLVTFLVAVVVMFWNFCGFLSWSSCYEKMFLIGGVVVAWLCRSLVVGSRFDCVRLGLIVFDCVDLGLLWLVSWSGFNLGLICWEFGVDCVRIWGRTWRIRWSWFVVDLMVLGLMISKVLNLGFFFLFSFMS